MFRLIPKWRPTKTKLIYEIILWNLIIWRFLIFKKLKISSLDSIPKISDKLDVIIKLIFLTGYDLTVSIFLKSPPTSSEINLASFWVFPVSEK